jgi:eukaryotic-like serine/threonine-protein kinase
MVTNEVAGYVLLEPVGAGASSVVHRGYRRGQPGRVVAIKRLRDPAPDAVADLEREAAVLADLHHPAILPLLDVVPDGVGIALVLPFAAQGTLVDHLHVRGGALRWPEVADLGARLAGALAAAHGAGVLHGDVKPSNVLFGADGEPRLADFGAGRVRDVVVGTPGYVAPEVLAGVPPDACSDVYALGIVLREALGASPGEGGGDGGVPADLRAVLDRAAAADPADRYPSARALQTELAAVAGRAEAARYDRLAVLAPGAPLSSEDPVAPTPASVPAPTHPAPATPPAPTQVFGPRPPAAPSMPSARSRRRVPTGVVAVAALFVVAAVGGFALWPGTSEPDAVAAALAPRVPAPPCDDGAPADALLADVAGRGCSVPLDLTTEDVDGRPMVILTLPASAGEVAGRYAVAAAGEIVLLGDWDCNGTDTPAVVRPATGEVFTYAGFGAVAAEPQPDRIDGAPQVMADGTCDRVVGD